MEANPIRCQYGLWDSPITPKSMTAGIGLADVAWAESGELIWLEKRAKRNALVVLPPNGDTFRDLNDILSVRARLGYGGGDFTIADGRVYFVEAESGRIYQQALAGVTAKPVTPAFGDAASPSLSPDRHWLLFVHSYDEQDCLAIVDTSGNDWPQKLAAGTDFYMQPTWHPSGQAIAWVEWNHPNMPWDGTSLYLGRLRPCPDSLPVLAEKTLITGDEHTAIFQPEFSPNGCHLAYVSDQSGWWQLYLYDLEAGEHHQLTHAQAEHGAPAWVHGMRTYAFTPDGEQIIFIRNQNSVASLWKVDIVSEEISQLPLDESYTWLEQIAVSPSGRQLALLASGSRTPKHLIVYTLAETGAVVRSSVNKTRVIRRTLAEELPQEAYSKPEIITWAGMDGGSVYGLYYPPHNPAYEGIKLPPLLILIHGGPTSQRTATFDLQVQFFTSRGYAVLQVNHRGSTGYGRLYRDMLRSNWGIYDVEDSVSAVHHLVGAGLVDGECTAIMGSSAGGYTVFQALVNYPGTFKAGISLYGISNQLTAASDTHKFELRYTDNLLGSLPEAAQVYRERSPIFHLEKIQDPVAIFHGEDDSVVPLNNSAEVAATLERRGVPHIYHAYPGEGHGFRKPETIEHLYTAIDKFLRKYVINT